MLDPLTVLRRGPGLVLLAGPTGSGKNTTAMALLQALDLSAWSAATIELAPRVALAGVQQTVVATHDDQLAMLGRLLAMDLDLLYVRELHSPAVASTVLTAATHRRVISTIHTADSTSVLDRLENMGAAPDLVVEGLSVVQAQRWLRRLCPDCRRPTTASGRAIGREGTVTVSEPVGCERCRGTGYRGRILATERFTLGLSPGGGALRREFLRGVRGAALRNAAIDAGLVTLRASAVQRVLRGETSLQEAIVSTPPDA